MTDDSPLSPALAAALAAARAMPASRLMPLGVEGRRYWLKRPARPRSRLRRLLAGDPAARALAADRAGLARMAALGLPAPQVLAEGPDFVLTDDAGLPLITLLRDPDTAEDARLAALAEGARALAALHRAGAAHGAPTIRALCWRPGRGAALIDFEAFVAEAGPPAQARDARLFLTSVLRLRRHRDGFFDIAAQAYREAAPPAVWGLMHRRARRLRWSVPLARLALRVAPKAHGLRAALSLRAALTERV